MLTRTYWRTVSLAACAMLVLVDVTDNRWIFASMVAGCSLGASGFNHLYLERRDRRYQDRQMRQLIDFLRPRTFDAEPESYQAVLKVQEILDGTDVLARPLPLSEFMLRQLQITAMHYDTDPEYDKAWRPR